MGVYANKECVYKKLRSTGIKTTEQGLDRISIKKSPTGDVRKRQNNYDLQFSYRDVEISQLFFGKLKLEIEFQDDTNFTVYEVNDKDVRGRNIGTGDINTLFTTIDDEIRIPSSVWGGTIEQYDIVQLDFKVDVSDEEVEEYISEVEMWIDNLLISETVCFKPDTLDLIFEMDVPPEIETATCYLATYFIYTDVSSVVQKGSKEKDCDGCGSKIKRMADRAKRILEQFMKKKLVLAGVTKPIVISYPSKMKQVGVPHQYDKIPGLEERTSDLSSLQRDDGYEQIEDRMDDERETTGGVRYHEANN